MKPTLHKTHFKTLYAILVTTLLLGFTGCAPSTSQGQTIEQANTQLTQLDGVAPASRANTGSMWQGFERIKDSTVLLRIKDGYEIADTQALTDWLIRTTWSLNDQKPNSNTLVIVMFDQEPTEREWGGATAAEALGFQVISSPERVRSFSISIESLEEKLGPWPGDVPKLPVGALVETFDTPKE
ncbi:hypothetical protein [Lysinibacter sp. HNR]|uniref:hypothetical protein n=1 Tax=Lysinibacter sp. HNR TaxID=3031408 RepID=UPI00243554E9|nr:hypothetical protein [Lysinibacter sp. HNR]WGD36432.1 hypothetical protein FrondiHNR_08060 [Lysinibacter sp. HNR]